jgi:RsiW-degrading membrane proteinase PrsW (M82 family)
VSIFQSILAVVIAAGIPAVFLLLIYALDLYASRSFRLALLSFLWGALGAFSLAYVLNDALTRPLARMLEIEVYFLMVVGVAPVVEEIAKSLSLFYIARRHEFTYFVDGAIYGFASGIGFSIIENFLYVSRNPSTGLGLAFARAFSTCLMHGTASGLVGVAIGRFRFHRRSGRRLALAGGWLAAILLHMLFNRVAWAWSDRGVLGTLLGIGIGLGGVGLIALFISLGIREQRQWLLETLDRQVGVTAAESRVVQAYGSLDELLEPVFQQFPHQAELVEAFLQRQLQIGIKRKVRQRLEDPQVKELLEQEIEQLRGEMDTIRREAGVYVMTYVRAMFPDEALPIWSRLELVAAQGGPEDEQRWVQMLTVEEVNEADEQQPSERNIFARLSE